MSTASLSVPDDLRRKLRQYGQEHVLAWCDARDAPGRRTLLEQVRGLDLDLLKNLYADRDHSFQVPPADRIEPAPIIPHDSPDNSGRRRLGEEALRRGEAAVLLVAGGQG